MYSATCPPYYVQLSSQSAIREEARRLAPQTHNVFPQGLAVELLGLWVVAWESLLGVGNVETAVRGALEDTKDSGSGRGSLEAGVEEALEGSRSVLVLSLGQGELALWLSDALVLLIESELLESTSGNEEAGGVGCVGGKKREAPFSVAFSSVLTAARRLTGSPVGEAVRDAVSRELVGVGRGEDDVALDLGIDDLGDDVLVCESDDEAVLWRVVLVLGLGDEALPGVVVGLALSVGSHGAWWKEGKVCQCPSGLSPPAQCPPPLSPLR